ncbi:MAG: VWA domain-containing protein [Bacteroidales bacterium]|nr:VWA domain-containing protein [Bacteroidales bacterium]
MFCAIGLKAQNKEETPTTNILFIFDASQSMYGSWESDKKINIARKYLIRMIDSLENLSNVQMALRVYGHQSPVPPQDCSDTKLEIPFSKNNAGQIRQKLRFLIPKGTSPITNSLLQAANDFPKYTQCRNIIILITDGIEACDGDPCQASLDLQKRGIVLKPFIIGIGLDPKAQKMFDCVGHTYNSIKEEKFNSTLKVVISRILNSTTAQVNLLDANGIPSETNVNMTFFDHISGKVKYNLVHTMNYMGNPDTLVIDPLVKYDIIVHTIPAVKKENIELAIGKHNTIGLSTPQGILKVTNKSNLNRDVTVLVKSKDSRKTINTQKINSEIKYLAGTYSLEILTIPRLYIDNVEIHQSTTTKVDIPRPGIANFSLSTSGYGSIYKETADTLQWIYNLNETQLRQNLIILPGDYRVVFRAKNSRDSKYTIDKRFKIKSGASKKITLF